MLATQPRKRRAPKSAKVEARCGKRLKLQISHARKSTGYDETDFVLTALAEFFDNHKTPNDKIAAVQRNRAKSQPAATPAP